MSSVQVVWLLNSWVHLTPGVYSSCANRAKLATAWSTVVTCTVCGHPTMSNYFTMYYYKIVGAAVLLAITATSYYKIVGVAALAFAYHSSYHCYSYYLSEVHIYCLWPLPHIRLVCPFSVDPY